MSKFHFARLFRESTGASPHAFLVQLRMEAARRLLTTTDLGVAEVAARCGFARPAHFGAAFARRFGVSPTAFRGRSKRSRPYATRRAPAPSAATRTEPA